MRKEDIEDAARYFASAGSLYDAERSPRLLWLPYCSGKLLRHFWKRSREAVLQLVPPRAVELMDQEFGPSAPARQFEHWPTDQRREIYALTKDAGCMWWVDEHGNTLPNGIRSMETYREDLARMRAGNDHAN